MNGEPLVDVRGLRKSFGDVRAVDDVSFTINRGQVVGFIGENGAGKTTTMRMLVTLELPDAGRITLAGHDALDAPNEVRRRVGWMPDAYGAYDATTVWEYLDFFARAYGYRGAERVARVDEVMAFTELDVIAGRPMNKLSKGMGQRLCLGRTLLPDPDLLVLDEPAAGLDPKARIEFKNLVRLLAAQGKTLFISSHILSELEQMCDAMLFISGGRIVHHGTSESLKVREGAPTLVRVGLVGDAGRVAEWISLQPGVELFEQDATGLRLRVEQGTPEALAGLLRALHAGGFSVCEFHREQIRLEDAFVDILSRQSGGERAS
jgi:ABC-2 type transport system ATP-binding protein